MAYIFLTYQKLLSNATLSIFLTEQTVLEAHSAAFLCPVSILLAAIHTEDKIFAFYEPLFCQTDLLTHAKLHIL